MKLFYITSSTPVGDFHIIFEQNPKNEDIVRAAGFGGLDELRDRLSKQLESVELEKAQTSHPYTKLIAAYFDGDKNALSSIPYKQKGTPFNKRVWKEMSNIKYGETKSYRQLASFVGSPQAVRAVGSACGKNLLAVIVPCHRVLRSDGSLGGYYYGLKIKDYLLKMEGK